MRAASRPRARMASTRLSWVTGWVRVPSHGTRSLETMYCWRSDTTNQVRSPVRWGTSPNACSSTSASSAWLATVVARPGSTTDRAAAPATSARGWCCGAVGSPASATSSSPSTTSCACCLCVRNTSAPSTAVRKKLEGSWPPDNVEGSSRWCRGLERGDTSPAADTSDAIDSC